MQIPARLFLISSLLILSPHQFTHAEGESKNAPEARSRLSQICDLILESKAFQLQLRESAIFWNEYVSMEHRLATFIGMGNRTELSYYMQMRLRLIARPVAGAALTSEIGEYLISFYPSDRYNVHEITRSDLWRRFFETSYLRDYVRTFATPWRDLGRNAFDYSASELDKINWSKILDETAGRAAVIDVNLKRQVATTDEYVITEKSSGLVVALVNRHTGVSRRFEPRLQRPEDHSSN